MSVFDKFLEAIRLNDDYDEEDDFLDREDDLEEDTPRKRFFHHRMDEEEGEESAEEEPKEREKKTAKAYNEPKKATQSKSTSSTASQAQTAQNRTSRTAGTSSSKVTPMRKKAGTLNMEVCVIKPASMEDTREIADTLLAGCTVVLNLEGIDVDIAQRIIDFCCGSCYCMNGSLRKVSSYIFILSPSSVEISGDMQDILSGAFDIPSIRTDF